MEYGLKVDDINAACGNVFIVASGQLPTNGEVTIDVSNLYPTLSNLHVVIIPTRVRSTVNRQVRPSYTIDEGNFIRIQHDSSAVSRPAGTIVNTDLKAKTTELLERVYTDYAKYNDTLLPIVASDNKLKILQAKDYNTMSDGVASEVAEYNYQKAILLAIRELTS